MILSHRCRFEHILYLRKETALLLSLVSQLFWLVSLNQRQSILELEVIAEVSLREVGGSLLRILLLLGPLWLPAISTALRVKSHYLYGNVGWELELVYAGLKLLDHFLSTVFKTGVEEYFEYFNWQIRLALVDKLFQHLNGLQYQEYVLF